MQSTDFQQMLFDPGHFNPYQINIMFDRIQADLQKNYQEISKCLSLINPKDNPQCYFQLMRTLIYNRTHAQDSKGKGLDLDQIFNEVNKIMIKMVEQFSMPDNCDWYYQLGNLMMDFANFAYHTDRIVQAIRVVKLAMAKVKDSENQYTNLHTPFVYLCYRAGFYQHTLPVISVIHTDFKQGYKSDSKDPKKDFQHNITKSEFVKQMIQYNHYRGLIYLKLKRNEDAYFCFAKALSMPHFIMEGSEVDFSLLQSYQKMLILAKIVDNSDRSALKLPYLLHFINVQNLQQLKSQSMAYNQLISAFEGKKIDDMDDNDQVNDKTEQKIERVLALHTIKEFAPRGDEELIAELIEERQLIQNVKDLKKVYTQVAISKVSTEKNVLARIQNLLTKGKLPNTKIDDANGTLRFEDLEVQQSSMNREEVDTQDALKVKEQSLLISNIEAQNLELVSVLQEVRGTTHNIQNSTDYAVQRKLGKRGSGITDTDHDEEMNEYDGVDDETMARMLAAGNFGDENERATH